MEHARGHIYHFKKMSSFTSGRVRQRARNNTPTTSETSTGTTSVSSSSSTTSSSHSQQQSTRETIGPQTLKNSSFDIKCQLEEIPRLHWRDSRAIELAAASRPVVFTGTGLVDVAIKKWTLRYLLNHLNDSATFTVYKTDPNNYFMYDKLTADGTCCVASSSSSLLSGIALWASSSSSFVSSSVCFFFILFSTDDFLFFFLFFSSPLFHFFCFFFYLFFLSSSLFFDFFFLSHRCS